MTYRFIVSFIVVLLLGVRPLFAADAGRPVQKLFPPVPKPAGPKEEKGSPLNVLSIIPAQGEAGTSVILSGTGFTEKTSAFLGTQEIPTQLLGPKQLTFDIPKLPPGLYALFLKREDGTTSKTYNFALLPQKPVVTSLSPEKIDACATGRDRDVNVSGHNFLEKSQVLFDGAAIRTRFLSSDSLSFNVPQIPAGLHQVQVRNPEETSSGVLGLLIDAKPEIETISQGEEFVNYYNLIINGKNFQQGSALVIMEERSMEQMGSQLPMDVKRLYSGSANSTERERLIFLNCNRMIYQRYPYSTVLKNIRIQVVNPNGEDSSVMSISAP